MRATHPNVTKANTNQQKLKRDGTTPNRAGNNQNQRNQRPNNKRTQTQPKTRTRGQEPPAKPKPTTRNEKGNPKPTLSLGPFPGCLPFCVSLCLSFCVPFVLSLSSLLGFRFVLPFCVSLSRSQHKCAKHATVLAAWWPTAPRRCCGETVGGRLDTTAQHSHTWTQELQSQLESLS